MKSCHLYPLIPSLVSSPMTWKGKYVLPADLGPMIVMILSFSFFISLTGSFIKQNQIFHKKNVTSERIL